MSTSPILAAASAALTLPPVADGPAHVVDDDRDMVLQPLDQPDHDGVGGLSGERWETAYRRKHFGLRMVDEAFGKAGIPLGESLQDDLQALARHPLDEGRRQHLRFLAIYRHWIAHMFPPPPASRLFSGKTTPSPIPLLNWDGETWTPQTGDPRMSTSPTPAASAAREDKFIGQDGPIWPVARAAMVDVNAIHKRMAEDVAEIARDRTEIWMKVEASDLVYRGWTRQQVAVHGDYAVLLAEGL